MARNAANRTPREEAEVTLQRVESDDLASTATFLRDEERRRSQKSTSLYSDISDDDDSNGDDDAEDFGAEEPENEDVAKFLGVTKSSPDVQNAFRCLGIASSHKSTPNRVTSASHVTPMKRSDKAAKTGNRNSQVNGVNPKVRLTYETGIVEWTLFLVLSKNPIS